MRKIERQIIEAINKGRQLQTSRDRVLHPLGAGPVAHAYLHNTCIVKVYLDRLVLNSGGWYTNTTKSRMNALLWEYCASRIYQKDFVWYIHGANAIYDGNPLVEFCDGIVVPRRNKRWDGDRWVVSL